jgi:hypothetical protein
MRDESCIKGVEDPLQLDGVLAFSQMSLPQADPGSGLDIPFVHVEEVICLNGLHRVEAAKRWLREGEKWWTIKLFANGKTRPSKCFRIVLT